MTTSGAGPASCVCLPGLGWWHHLPCFLILGQVGVLGGPPWGAQGLGGGLVCVCGGGGAWVGGWGRGGGGWVGGAGGLSAVQNVFKGAVIWVAGRGTAVAQLPWLGWRHHLPGHGFLFLGQVHGRGVDQDMGGVGAWVNAPARRGVQPECAVLCCAVRCAYGVGLEASSSSPSHLG